MKVLIWKCLWAAFRRRVKQSLGSSNYGFEKWLGLFRPDLQILRFLERYCLYFGSICSEHQLQSGLGGEYMYFGLTPGLGQFLWQRNFQTCSIELRIARPRLGLIESGLVIESCVLSLEGIL